MTTGSQTIRPAAPTLAERYNPAPVDVARYETAIARRNTAWAHWREAADLLAAAGLRGADTREVTRNYNDCLDDYERARADLIRERVIWRTTGVPW
jgi:hypothetical protein